MSRRGNPLLRLDLQRWRTRVVLGLMLAGFVTLTARAAYLQGWNTKFLSRQGELRAQRVDDIPAHRGMITDRRGEPVAISTPVESIWLNPRQAKATPQQIQALASRLGLDPDTLGKAFSDRRKTYVYLKRQVSPELAASILDLKVVGVHSTPEFRRYYPAGEVMGQVLGMTGVDDRGLEGLEYGYQSWLGGEPGARRVLKDRLGNVIEELDILRLPKHGRDLTLSINLQLQYLAYRELAAAVSQHRARAGALVVLDARSGEILALANVPSYNPNSRALLDARRMRNRALADVFEPGSTIKPFLVAAALDAGVVTPETRIDTGAGWLLVGEKRISDVHPKGEITVAEAIQVSSNVATAKIALDMKSEDYWQMLNGLGFGAPPGAGLPGEAGGRLRPYEGWRPIEKATMAFGHGLSVSLLQLARAYCVFANDGVLPRPTVLKRDAGAPGVRAMSPETARTLRAMLETVTGDDGTAPMARVMGYRVAGKTGTARKLVNGVYSRDKYVSSFVGMAPASRPRLVTAVMIDEPGGREYYGGLVAAPVFSRVMAGALRFLAIPPDAPLEELPAVPATVVGEAA